MLPYLSYELCRLLAIPGHGGNNALSHWMNCFVIHPHIVRHPITDNFNDLMVPCQTLGFPLPGTY